MTKRILTILTAFALCFVLCACSENGESAVSASPLPTAEPTAAPEPTLEPTPEPPGSFTIMGVEYDRNADTVDLTGITDSEAEETAAALAQMPAVKTVILGSDETSSVSWANIKTLQEACPDADFDYSFTLFRKKFTLNDSSMDIKYNKIEDEGALIKEITACMPNLTFLDMDSCGVSNESMAELRDSLPDCEVVWRIFFGDHYTARTNVEKILASLPGKGGELVHDNVMDLKYCTKVKYLDLGHNNYLDTIEFCRYMPDLEVLIVGMTFVEDFSPLAGCPKLEYLEAMTSRLHDLTPLAGLKNLRHLNICYNFAITDISPLYNLTELERLWIGRYDPVPPEQIEQMQKAAPNCVINTEVGDPTNGGWRYVGGKEAARYKLLREQMGYYDEAYAFTWLDPYYRAF